MSLAITNAWIVECQRCSNSDYSLEETAGTARAELEAFGWADDSCPACNGSVR